MKIDELKSLLARFHIKPNHVLGQNFLLSETVLDQIVAAAELSPEDLVLEIGPGLGFLTQRLAEVAREVIAVEKDRKLCRALSKLMKSYKNVKIICGDALHETYNMKPETQKYKVVANIPYYLTGKILQKFLSGNNAPQPPLKLSGGERAWPARSDSLASLSRERSGETRRAKRGEGELFTTLSLMVFLLQKEVAERIAAKPGQMSILSVSVQLYADPEIMAYVGRENFYPAPEVDSAIVRLRVLAQPRFEVNDKKLMQLVKIGFSNKRKMLHNNLQALPTYDLQYTIYKHLLSSLGLNPLARAQDLSLEDWVKLYKKLQI